MLAVKSQMAESSCVAEVGEVPINMSILSFQDAGWQVQSCQLSFQGSWFSKWQWLHYESTTDLAFCHTCVTAIKMGKMKIAGNVKGPAFIYNGLHFPQMKLASKNPPEAVLEGVIFKIFLVGSIPPRHPTLWCAKHAIPHPLWSDRFFLASYGPDD